MPYFNFKALINKYNCNFTLVTHAEGYYNDCGDWIKGEAIETAMNGAIIGFSENKTHRSEGTLTTQDRRLFMLEPIEKALKGSKVIYDNNVFNIEERKENAKFTGVYAYTLKWVSAFNKLADESMNTYIARLKESSGDVL